MPISSASVSAKLLNITSWGCLRVHKKTLICMILLVMVGKKQPNFAIE